MGAVRDRTALHRPPWVAAAGAGLGGLGRRHRQQHALEPGGVLGRAPTTHAHPADAVLGDRQEPALVGRPLLPLQRLLVAGVRAVGVESLQDVPTERGEYASSTLPTPVACAGSRPPVRDTMSTPPDPVPRIST